MSFTVVVHRPLIKRVVLHGPWKVLSSGACLVDLPGVKDSNVARAKVASTYLRNCSCIWIVAPIKRAVDDGTVSQPGFGALTRGVLLGHGLPQ